MDLMIGVHTLMSCSSAANGVIDMKNTNDPLRYLVILLFIITIALIGIQSIPGWGNLSIFLISSLLLVVYAFTNLLYVNRLEYVGIQNWKKYSVLLFIAMVFGSVGDFAMPGLFLFPTSTPLLNGILYFGIGHAFYLIALNGLSPFLLSTHERRLIVRNLAAWLIFVIFVVTAFLVTVYNPTDQVLSIGALGYGILLISAAAFAFTKWFDDYPKPFKLSLIFGFIFFFISDWVIAIRNFRDSTLLSDTSFVGVTYLIGQLLIHSALLLGYWIYTKNGMIENG